MAGTQTHLGTSIEVVVSTFVGYWVAVGANLLVLPFYGYKPTFIDANEIAVIFTLISLVRGYLLRRVFNWLHFGHR